MIDDEDIQYYKSLNWAFKIWKPTPALIDKHGFSVSQFIGQKFDPNYFTVDMMGWKHDHCEICWKKICANEDECETNGFNSEGQWICSECHTQLFNSGCS